MADIENSKDLVQIAQIQNELIQMQKALSAEKDSVKMNRFLVMAESYKKLMEQGKIEKEMRIYEFLATCDSDDLHIV